MAYFGFTEGEVREESPPEVMGTSGSRRWSEWSPVDTRRRSSVATSLSGPALLVGLVPKGGTG